MSGDSVLALGLLLLAGFLVGGVVSTWRAGGRIAPVVLTLLAALALAAALLRLVPTLF